MRGDGGGSDGVFKLDASPVRLRVGADDRVSAVAAAHGTVWAGTERGRLFRYEGGTGAVDDVGGLAGGACVTRIYADPRSRAALVLSATADAFHVRSGGALRPRAVAKLRGMRCSAAAWAPPAPGVSPNRRTMLLGTALGSLFCHSFDEDGRDETVERLWAAPGGEAVDGVRVERVAGKLVAIVATRSKLYAFYDQEKLEDLFAAQSVSAVQRKSDGAPSESADLPLPSELVFMSGSSALASRRFVWAGGAGVTHAQLAVRRRRSTPAGGSGGEESGGDGGGPSGGGGGLSVVASVVDKATLTWGALKDAAGSGAPLAVNLTAWHVLILYPGSIYAYSHISGALTQRLDVWAPGTGGLREGRDIGEGLEPSELLAAPAAGLARDVARDVLWVFSEDGQLARVAAGDEQFVDAWRQAHDVGRFDLAMVLAPSVAPDAVVETRMAVLRAQADDAAAAGDWEAAASLFAKTEKPVEQVVLAIHDAAADPNKDDRVTAEKRAEMVSYVLEYLVRKLDQIDPARHTQRTLVALVLVQLYAGVLSSQSNLSKRDDIATDFRNFLADHHQDLDVPTATRILAEHGCVAEARALADIARVPGLALHHARQRERVDEVMDLLREARERGDRDTRQTAVNTLQHLVHCAPARVQTVLSDVGEDEASVDELRLLSSLARTARTAQSEVIRAEAYSAAVRHARASLRRARAGTPHWGELFKYLFELHAQSGDEANALVTVEQSVKPLDSALLGDKQVRNALASALRSALSARQSRTAVALYVALGDRESAVRVALEVDPALAEATLEEADDAPRELWREVAARGDGLAVAARSRGALAVHDVLDAMEPFDSAGERVKNAVAGALREHRRVALEAEASARAAVEASTRLRSDVARAKAWRASRPLDAVLSCGHPRTSAVCARCGDEVIDELDRVLDDAVELPIILEG